jgi:hypothetical protein
MQTAVAVARHVPRGNLSDLYPRWLGARELLLHGRDPYSPEITREIQIGYYGRPLDNRRPNDPKDQEGFAYPVYVVFLLAPTIFLPFSIVQTVFHWLLFAVVAATSLLWFEAFRWKVRWFGILIGITLALGNFPAIQALALRQLSVIVAGFLALVIFLISRRKFLLAGAVLAIATIKPQLTLPIVCWLIVWIAGRWRERKGLAFGLISAMAALFAAAQWILPGWMIKFYHAVLAYREYTGGLTAADVLFGMQFGIIADGLLIIFTAIICWRYRKCDEKTVSFYFVSCFVLAATVALAPIFAPYNQLLLFPGLLFLVQHRSFFQPRKSWQKTLLAFTAAAIFWQWIASIVLTASYFLISERLVLRIWQVPFYMSLPFPVIIMVLLYVCSSGIQVSSRRLQFADVNHKL